RELEQRDLAVDAEARRRSPVARAAADVEPCPADAMEAGDDRLEEADDEVEREELAAVRVAGELKADAEAIGGAGRLRAMRQQDFERLRRRTRERGVGIARMRVAADRIGDA